MSEASQTYNTHMQFISKKWYNRIYRHVRLDTGLVRSKLGLVSKVGKWVKYIPREDCDINVGKEHKSLISRLISISKNVSWETKSTQDKLY